MTLGYGRCRLAAAVPADTAVPDRRGPGRSARRDGPPEYGPPVLRRTAASRSRSSRSRARSRSRRGSVWPRRSSISSRPARPWSMNGLRQIGDVLASEAVLVANPAADARARPTELAAIDTMLSAVIAARGRKYLMMNAPAATLPDELEALLPGPRIADRHPARPRRDDRHPLGRRRGRGLGPPAAPQGRRRLGHPRPADREDRPVSATEPTSSRLLRRLTSPRVAAGDPAARRRPRRARPPRRRPRPARPRGGARHPRGRPSARRRRRPRGQPARSVADVRTAASSSTQTDLRAARDAPRPARPPRPRPGDRPRPPLRRDPATGLDPHDDRPGHRDRTPLDAARAASAPTSRADRRRTRRRW